MVVASDRFFHPRHCWISIVNLSSGAGHGAGKEVGVRKAIGAKHGQLVNQFMMEGW
ncbi:MAG: hypothetical protein IPJ82_24930 [Lewinellaceae bacterium]|nr:hypothetical protein [Lewinellaceae bacterium]